jgi:transcriptional regulator with XRE-family HTH domain
MFPNFEFGQRVKQAREKLGISRKHMSRLLGIDNYLLEMIESQQMDENRLTDEELKQFTCVLHRSLCWLLHGGGNSHGPRCNLLEELSSTPQLPAEVLALRESRGPVQKEFDLGPAGCPQCPRHLSVWPSRCPYCGFGLD